VEKAEPELFWLTAMLTLLAQKNKRGKNKNN